MQRKEHLISRAKLARDFDRITDDKGFSVNDYRLDNMVKYNVDPEQVGSVPFL